MMSDLRDSKEEDHDRSETQPRLPAMDSESTGGLRPLSDADAMDRLRDRVDHDETRKLGPYTILDTIGEGGQACVYLAFDDRLDRRVALKVLSGLDGAKAKARFRREAEIASRLDHVGICPVYDVGFLDEGEAYIAMRLIEGPSLAELVGRAAAKDSSEELVLAPRTQEEIEGVVGVVLQLARALEVAHAAGIVHRDVKPANAVLCPDRGPVLLDFGVAKDKEGLELTLDGDVFGTPPYMAPEQIRGERVDARVDVYALGITLFELLTLRRPFEGKSVSEIFHVIQTREAPSLRRLNPALPRDLEAIVATAIEKNPAQRYRSARLLSEDLEAFLSHRTVRARPLTPPGMALRWLRREPLKAGLLAALMLAIVSAALLFAHWADIREFQRVEDQREAERLVDEAYGNEVTLNGHSIDKFRRALRLQPAHSEARLGLAIALRNQGRNEEALETLAHPSITELHSSVRKWFMGEAPDRSVLGEDDLRQSGLRETVRALMARESFINRGGRVPLDALLRHSTRAILESAKPRAISYYLRAEAAGWLENRGVARDAANDIRRLFPQFPFAWHYAASAERCFDLDRAEESYLRFIEMAGPTPGAYSNLADIRRATGRLAEAERALRLAADLDPESPLLLRNLGLVLGDQGRHAEAIEELARAEAQNPKDASISYHIGLYASRAQRRDEAFAAYDRCLALEATHLDALNNLAALHATAGEYEESLALLIRAQDQAPKNIGTHHQLATVYERLGRDEDHWRVARHLLELAPLDSANHNRLGYLHEGRGEFESAIDRYRRGRELGSKTSIDLARLARLLARAGETGAATTHVEALLLRNDLGPLSNAVLAETCLELGRLEDAAKVAQRPMPDGGLSIEGALVLVSIQLELGVVDEAMDLLDNLINRWPDEARVHRASAEAWAAQGDYDEALIELDRFLAVHPKDDAARTRRLELELARERARQP